ncbi:MAG TPA: sodium-translocating pyrophosphatase [Egibacteraceae bacterium]|nr:sodium-translocating pyrophosphatase [Egibacteraceae bacterium]
MDAVPALSAAAAIAGLVLAAYFFGVVKRADPGNDRMVELMNAIQAGARAFLRREYTWVAGFVVIMTVLIVVFLDYGRPWGAIAYISGALLSGLAGFVGMTVATLANARTTQAARTGPQLALPLAFRGGAVMGFTVAGLALLGLSLAYIVFVQVLGVDQPFQVVTAFGLGASSIALFSRVGGGIYTKAADVGADLVGKVEAGIPEDDPRNPATIADNVGDNVGDVAGMGADLFESYAGSIIAPIALAAFAFAGMGDFQERALLFPLAIGAFGMLASIVGAFTVKSKPNATGKDLARSLHRGTNVAALITVVLAFAFGYVFFEPVAENWWGFPVAVVAGLLVGMGIGFVSEYYTSDHYGPVRKIARQSETGPATTILGGISAGLMSVASAVVLIVIAVGVAYWAANYALPDVPISGIYGIALAAIGMLATTGVVVSVDAYGPIADNAGGIAEMAHLPPEVREVTDSLDSLGNTTAAIAKGFAVGSAAVTALALFKAFEQAVIQEGGAISLDIGSVDVFSGLFLGAMLPFLFAALTIDAVGRAANKMIEEVRRQFREIPGLREGREGVVPEYAKCVDISTAAALREMLIPGGMAVVAPLAIGFFLGVDALGGFLAGALVSGFALAIFMANSGGAWDNAKKYIEAGHHGGKGSEPHKAAVVGDTVGDPFKDTAGPSMNILIKVMTIVSLIFASAFV